MSIFDLNDQIVSQVTATGAWTRGEVFAGSRHLATYVNGTGGTTLFAHGDWLGTERMRTNTTGASVETFTSLPFGDALSQFGSSPLHLTSKERDTESQLDYFGARYYSSAMGRFMVPDWAAKPTNIPYASFGNPQTLNLYSYVGNDPTNHADPDGHESANTTTAGPCSGPDNCTKVIDDGNGTPQAAQDSVTPATTTTATAATVTASPTTIEEIDAVVKPLIDSAVSAGEKAGSFIVDAGETALGALAFVLTVGVGHTADEAHDTVHSTPTPVDEHKSGARESTREKHEEGQARKRRDRGGEKGDASRRPPRKPPNGWKGPWPPKPGTDWW